MTEQRDASGNATTPVTTIRSNARSAATKLLINYSLCWCDLHGSAQRTAKRHRAAGDVKIRYYGSTNGETYSLCLSCTGRHSRSALGMSFGGVPVTNFARMRRDPVMRICSQPTSTSPISSRTSARRVAASSESRNFSAISLPESLHHIGQGLECRLGQLPLEMIDIDIDNSFLSGDVAKFGDDLRIIGVPDAAPHQLVHIGAFAVDQSIAGSQPLEFGTALGDRRLAAVEPRLEQSGQPCGFQHAIDERIDHNPSSLPMRIRCPSH